jgi:hypothetical protein
MAGSSKFPTYLVPDDGVRYAYGDLVSLDQSSGRIEIVKDPQGDYEVMNFREATEYTETPTLLRVGLRKRETTPPTTDPESWSRQFPGRW